MTDFEWTASDGRAVKLSDLINHLNTTFAGDEIVDAQIGHKYIKLCFTKHQRSVYAFIDRRGFIYKPKGWRAPARGVRGSVFDPNYSYGRAFGRYGVAHLR